jgi:hypothetical protein
MASSTTSPPPAPGAGHPPVLVRDAGGLVAAVPVLLGFHPRESMVLVATGGASGRRVGLTLRVDLPPPEHAAAVCAAAAASLLAGQPSGAAVVVLAGGAPGAGAAAPPYRELAGAAVAALQARGVPAHTVVWAEATAAGSRWSCYEECGCAGLLPDPAGTEIAAAATAAGHVVYAGRDELERLVAATDRKRLRRRDRLLTARLDAVTADADPAGAADVAACCAVLEAAVADAAAGRLALDDERVVALATALTTPAVRDRALAACAGSRAAGAEQLWAALARETPDPEAAEPAALLAVSALLRGDGALANVALDRAERAWPGHRRTAMLRAAADLGLPPDRIRECLLTGDPAQRARQP